MKLITLGAAGINQTPLDWDGNHARMVAAVDEARGRGVGLLCLPELCITGYGCEDMFFSAGVQATALQQLDALAPATEGIAVAVGLPVFHESALYNAAALLVGCELVGIVAKQFLAGDGIHYEPRWFRRWPEGAVSTVEIDGRDVPFGDLLFDLGGVRVGFEICRDAWVANRPGARLARRGADVLLNPSGSHFAFAKQDVRRRLVLEGSRTFGASFVYCNILGNESGRTIYDGGVMIASGGEMVAEGPRFSFADHQLTTAGVDVAQTRQARIQSFDNGVEEDPSDGALVELDFVWPTPAAAGPTPPLGADSEAGWESSARLKEEEFTRAVALALFDYLRKSRAGGFVVSLSGGADSSAVTVLCGLMTRLAIAELGAGEFLQRLPSIPKLSEVVADAPPIAIDKHIAQRLLTCVYQATRNSSQTTRDAAAAVAQAVGAEFLEWKVDAMVDGYVETVSHAIGRPLDWGTDDLALQNVQARARGPGAWLLANLRGALLLATSNRSEAAVGYATMDGDTCGGLSPIGGIDKAVLRQWLAWMEEEGPAGLGPMPELSAVNRQAPTAELRPPAAGQTDERDLMPYPVLDAIERVAIRDKRLPAAALAIIRGQFPEYPAEQVRGWVDRFYRLWRQNQWKRERYAPSFHLDDENLDPKTWCRFPILSSAYKRELESLPE
ncbi:MAG: NAD(+) synthase [Planctomycetota bacterium]